MPDTWSRCETCNYVLTTKNHEDYCPNSSCPKYRKPILSEVFGPNGENPLTHGSVVFDKAPITRPAQAESIVEWMDSATKHVYMNRKIGETMAEAAERLDKEMGKIKAGRATVMMPTLKEGETITNSAGAKQSFIAADYECIPPVVLRLLAQCLGFGRRKYGFENWKNIPFEDNLNHAMNHIVEWRMGDRSEPHLVNAMARLTFALTQAVESNQQPPQYIRADE
jgi:hypothetical protein